MLKGFVARAIRLYEQEPGEPFGSLWFGLYVQRWVGWAWVDLPPIPTIYVTCGRLRPEDMAKDIRRHINSGE